MPPERALSPDVANRDQETPAARQTTSRVGGEEGPCHYTEDDQEVGCEVGDPGPDSCHTLDVGINDLAIGRPGVEDPSGPAGARALA